MSCLDCNTQNENSARFCENCGMDINHNTAVKNKGDKKSDIFLTVFIIASIFFEIIIQLIDFIVRIDHMFGNDDKQMVFIVRTIRIISYLIWLLLPLSIKNRRLRIIGLVLTSIFVAYRAGYLIYFTVTY